MFMLSHNRVILVIASCTDLSISPVLLEPALMDAPHSVRRSNKNKNDAFHSSAFMAIAW